MSVEEETKEVVTFTQDQVDEILAKRVEGLEKKNHELLGSLKDVKSKNTNIMTKAEKLEEESLKRNGDMEEYKNFYDSKIKELTEKHSETILKLENASRDRDKMEVINKLNSEFVDAEAGAFMLKNLVDINDGNPKFKDFAGNIVADNVEDFKNWMKSNPHMSNFIKGSKANGGGALGNTASDGVVKEITQRDIDNLPPVEKVKLLNSGVKVIQNKLN